MIAKRDFEGLTPENQNVQNKTSHIKAARSFSTHLLCLCEHVAREAV
jgi:hypothetical protein